MLRACMIPNPEIRSATSGPGYTAAGTGSLKQFQENWGNMTVVCLHVISKFQE
jgi:hypothetical protein